MADAEVVYGVSVQGFAEAQTALRAAYTEQQRALDLAREVEAAEAAAHAEDRARTARSIQMARDRAKAAAEEFDINVDAMERELELRREVEAAEKAAHAEDRARHVEQMKMSQERKKSWDDALHHANMATTATRETGHGIGMVADNIKNVGKDLDNLGLKSGKAFAMTAEGALSVVAALGAGGVAGVVGAVTVGIGYLAQAWANQEEEVQKSKKATEEALAVEEKRWSAANAAASAYLAKQKDVGIEQQRQNVVTQAAYLVELEKGIQEESDRFARGEVETNDRLLELQALYRAEEAEGIRMASEYKLAKAEDDADKMAKIEIEEAEASLRAQMDADKKKEEARRKAAEKAAKEREAELANLQKLHDADLKISEGKWAAEDKAKADAKKADMDLAQLLHDADMKMNDEKWAAEDRAAKSEKHRREELEKTAKALEEKRKAEELAARAALVATAVNDAYGMASMAVTPMINGMSNAVARLGELNRENAWQIREFVDDLPAIVAKEAQAFSARIAAEATGKAGMSILDAGRETALGVGMLFVPGGQAAASAHFKSAAIHAGMAAGYAGLAGIGAAGAVGIGMARGEGGLVGLTREEQQRNASRDGGGAGGGGGISGGRMSGSGGGDGGAFVVNIAYQAGSIAPADENRAARTVASATRRARSNAFDRRRMGA